jgi:hypothetical protein
VIQNANGRLIRDRRRKLQDLSQQLREVDEQAKSIKRMIDYQNFVKQQSQLILTFRIELGRIRKLAIEGLAKKRLIDDLSGCALACNELLLHRHNIQEARDDLYEAEDRLVEIEGKIRLLLLENQQSVN